MTQSKQFLNEQQDVAHLNQSDAYAGANQQQQIPQPTIEEAGFNRQTQPQVDVNSSSPQAETPVIKDKDNALAKALLAGAVGALVGTVAGAMANKVKPGSVNKAVKDIGDAVKSAAKGVSENLVGAVDAIKDQVEDIQQPDAANFNPATAPAKAQDNQSYNLYEERLVAAKQPIKAGEVVIGKHVETRTVQVSIPVDRERIFVERIAVNSQTPAEVGEAMFDEGEIARMEVYEERPLVQKRAFVRETIMLHKQIEHNTAEVQDNIRREELDLDIQGRNIVAQPNNLEAADGERA